MVSKKYLSMCVRFGTCIIIALFGFMLVTGVVSATAQQAAPTENKGITITALSAVDLGPEIPGMQARQLRLRMLTIEPGGVLAAHSHRDRPGAAYVLKGTVIEHRGDVAKEYSAGQTWAEDGNVIHWLENKGTSPAVLIVTDIFKQP
jgi:quercetin dioxygenase-like cupin family protein